MIFTASDTGRTAWFITSRGSMVSYPVVGYFADENHGVSPAVLHETSGAVSSVAEVGKGTLHLVSITQSPDTVPSSQTRTDAHYAAAEPSLAAAWQAFHAEHGHSACGHTPSDDWVAEQGDSDWTWRDEGDTAMAADLRTQLATQYKIDKSFTGCPHEFTDCSPTFCGRTT